MHFAYLLRKQLEAEGTLTCLLMHVIRFFFSNLKAWRAYVARTELRRGGVASRWCVTRNIPGWPGIHEVFQSSRQGANSG